MSRIVLESICDDYPPNIPEFYKQLDTKTFGFWKLHNYQEKALNNGLNALYLYFNNKEQMIQHYKSFDFAQYENDLCVLRDSSNFEFLSRYYPVNNGKIDFEHLMNRASFWMATGSGKTLVIIKLIELLFHLVKNNLIPQKDILFLAPKPRIIDQIFEHVEIFNKSGSLNIELRDLREWESVKFSSPNVYDTNKLIVFYYRSDNISSVDKTELLNYETVLNNGEWYILLDEAHKGDSESSVRQQYYSVLSRNGFLFNFSATFTDPIDIATTVYNFNLEKFINAGYGKHLRISGEQYKGFNERKDSDFTDSEKYQIVLKSCILFTAIKKQVELIKAINPNLYHNPLLITIANEVNTIKADLKLFFIQLAKIASNNYELKSAKDELVLDLQQNRNFQYRTGTIPQEFINLVKDVSKDDILKYVFHATSPGVIEWTKITNNSKEVAFRLKTAVAGKYFASLVASNAVEWGDNILADYEFNTTPIRDSFFDEIKRDDSEINVLLGSRIFSEGWDINRPNIINLINIGVDPEAQKFVLQAIGRGVRIEPIKDVRKRLNFFTPEEKLLLNSFISNKEHLDIIRNQWNTSVESLHIFATSKEVIHNIIENWNTASSEKYWTNITSIEKNDDITEDLLFATYESTFGDVQSYKLSNKEYSELFSYIGKERSNNDKILLMECPNNGIATLLDTLEIIRNEEKILTNGVENKATAYDNLLLLNKHFHQKPKKIKSFDKITNEIIHYRNVQVANLNSDEIKNLETLISSKCEKPKYSTRNKLIEALQNKLITADEFDTEDEKLKLSNEFSSGEMLLIINSKFLKEHYYRPIILTNATSKQYVKHVIDYPSEIDFLSDLEQNRGNLEKYDWWYFSKIDQTLDMISIPYYDNEEQKYSDFFPDFIFWLKKDDKYLIKFIDPKGRIVGLANAKDKALGYEKVFGNEEFEYSGLKIKTELFFYNDPVNFEVLSTYFTKDFDKIFSD